MGFLSSIITEVKKNTNLTIYNNNLETILNSIKHAKYNRKNFDSSIAFVSQGIQAWVRGVEEKNKAVMTPLENLEKTLEGHASVDMSGELIIDQLSTWRGFTALYLQEAMDSYEALNGIDDKLKKELSPKLDLIKQVVQHFWNSVNDAGVISSVEALDNNFTVIPQKLNKHIETEIQAAKQTLHQHHGSIESRINNHKRTTQSQIEIIRKAVKDAQKLIQDLLGDKGLNYTNRYKNNITIKIGELKSKVEEFAKNDGPKTALLQQFEVAQSNVSTLEKDVQKDLLLLRQRIEGLRRDVSTFVQTELAELAAEKQKLERITNDSGSSQNGNIDRLFVTHIQERLSTLISAVRTKIGEVGKDFGNAGSSKRLEDIFNCLEERVAGIKAKVGDTQPPGYPASDSIYYNWKRLKMQIESLVESIYKIDGRTRSGKLGEIIETLGTYATKIGTNMDKAEEGHSTVEKWAKEILDNEGVKRDISYYVKDRTMNNTVTTMVNAIMKQIKEVVKKVNGNKPRSGDTVQAILRGVYEYLKKVADAVGDKANSANIDTFITEIKREAKLQSADSTDNIYVHAFKAAVKTVLQYVSGAARNLATVFESLANSDAKISNVDDATQKAASIITKLGDKEGAGKQPGDGITKALKEATPKIGTLHGHLTKAAKTPGSNGVIPVRDLDNAIDHVKKEVDGLLGTFKANVTNKLGAAVDDFDTEAREKIQDAADTAIDQAVNVFGTGDIKVSSLMHQFESTQKSLTSAVDKIQEELEKLKNVPEVIRQAEAHADGLMEELKNKITAIKDTIDPITSLIGAAEKTLTKTVESIERALQAARDTSNRKLQDLKVDLQKQVNDAFNVLEEHVQKMFSDQRKTNFLSLRECITDQLPKIQQIIEHDFSTGLKGLMNKLSDTFEIHPISPSSIDFYIYTSHVKNFCHNFFHELSEQDDVSPYSTTMEPVTSSLDNLLDTIFDAKHFSAAVSSNLAELQTQLTALTPTQFAEASPLLNGVRAGVTAFHGELAKQYVSRYSGETFGANLEEKGKLTAYGTKLSKLFLTVVSTLRSSLASLRRGSRNLSGQQTTAFSDLGRLVADQGYDVCDSTTEQNGEVKRHLTGKGIQMSLAGNDYEHVYHTDNNVRRPLENMYIYLNDYYKIGHIATSSSKRRPCSIYEMLCWLSGLPCNDVYEDLWRDAVSELFVDPKNQPTENGDIPVTVVSEQPLQAYPHPIECNEAQRAVKRLCSRAYDVLSEIIGYGDAYTIYAVDFCNNSLNLHYPTDAASCLELLMDILRRLFPVFRFLHSQCKLETHHIGWSNCLYGRDISTGKSHCDKHPDDKQTDCLPRSPLQSYLSDTLPGHLPHNLTAMGCKSVCSNCPKGVPGQPCLTPLGFRGFSGSTKTGKELGEVLTKFFDNSNIISLFGLMPKPPSTLPEHFEFASALVRSWNEKIAPRHLTWLTDAVTKQSVKLHDVPTEFTDALRKAYGSSRNTHDHSTATSPDVSSLSMTKPCLFAPKDNIYCAPYLQSLCRDSYYYLAKKHSATYLSWALYLPWVFWNSLNNLYIGFCSIACQDWGCQGCLRGDDCKRGQHGANYNCKCGSIVNCRGVSSTFYAYGFTFGESSILLDTDGIRYCGHFYTQLRNVLNSRNFTELFNKCDEFLFKIRAPFIWLNVALWLLSLLYLIHIMVIRLDLLHIKSHLHSPSSHRIAAQSLLAAGRVNKLNRVFYLQP
ncbi:hypothetical protein BBBOND_0313930 [Babesia bigemina]|uniref:C3H1-type domain-containing protein n=1 Tax=Babesia bigemina TaxID=5866 RepID=A0A061D9V5_BABBI|nr:hypothetical protein BBBOND_0313930 [Babesia bigemina]CDR97491.1 hypothetical protein BBBOND_0313930 [Babesia bigemina]|eukprot:XP_012769677.1 hypothetical protein BBBOND_0313930 [Babesia bigemina]